MAPWIASLLTKVAAGDSCKDVVEMMTIYLPDQITFVAKMRDVIVAGFGPYTQELEHEVACVQYRMLDGFIAYVATKASWVVEEYGKDMYLISLLPVIVATCFYLHADGILSPPHPPPEPQSTKHLKETVSNQM